MKQNPPSFDGKPNPIEVENWFLQMEKLLEALDCTNSQNVRFATFKLIGEAEHWWRSTKAILEGMDTERNPSLGRNLKGFSMITTSLRWFENEKRGNLLIWCKYDD